MKHKKLATFYSVTPFFFGEREEFLSSYISKATTTNTVFLCLLAEDEPDDDEATYSQLDTRICRPTSREVPVAQSGGTREPPEQNLIGKPLVPETRSTTTNM